MHNTVPFGMIDHNDNWVPNPADYKPRIGLTKIFWIADIEKGYFDKLLHTDGTPNSLEAQLNDVLEGVRLLEDAEKRIRAHNNPEIVGIKDRVMEVESDELKPSMSRITSCYGFWIQYSRYIC